MTRLFIAGDDNSLNNPAQLATFATKAPVGIEMVFIGLGQGGGKMANTFAGIVNDQGHSYYTCYAINSNTRDLAKLDNIPEANKITLKGFENGCGHNPARGWEALMNNQEVIRSRIKQIPGKPRAVFVCTSFGGGTGTGGSADLAIWIAEETGLPVGLITSIPRKKQQEEIGNCLDALARVNNELLGPQEHHPIKCIIPIDNEKLYLTHQQDKLNNLHGGLDWMSYGNVKMAYTLHEYNVLTTMESDVILDPEDFLKILMSGGWVTFAKNRVRVADKNFTETTLSEQVIETVRGKNVLADGHNYQAGVTAGAFTLMTPENSKIANIDSLELMADKLKDEFPSLRGCLHQGHAHWSSKNYALIYTIMSLATMPERVAGLRQEWEEGMKEQEALTLDDNKIFINHEGGAAAPRHAAAYRKGSAQTSSNPFAVKTETAATTSNQPTNPFAAQSHPWKRGR